MLQLARNTIRHYPAVRVLVGINIKTTVVSTKIGWVWWLLDPLIMMGIYYFLIKGIFNRGGSNYHVFVLSGIISWQFFTRAITESTHIVTLNKQIIRQIAFPLPVMVVVPVITQLFFAAVGMGVVMIFTYSAINIATLMIIPLLLLIAMFGYGIGLFVSVLSIFLADTGKFVGYLLRAGFFATPILYPASRLLESPNIPEALKMILQINPMLWIIDAVRKVLLEGQMFDMQPFLIFCCVALFIIQIGLLWLRRNASTIVKML